MAVGQILRDFSGWTSAHGIPHIGSAQSMCLRIFWTVIFLGSTGMFVFQLILLIQKYLSYDVSVQTELKFEETDFPAVTVCNLNPYIEQELSNVDEMNQLVNDYNLKMTGTVFANDTWGFNPLNDTIAIQSRARDHLMLLAAKYRVDNLTIFNETTILKEHFIQNCAYNTKSCNLTLDFMEFIDPVYGSCFTFNKPPKHKSTRAGPLYGLRLLLKTNQTEYVSLTDSAGVRVTVHGPDEEPFTDAFGYNAAVGFTSSFGIKFIRNERKSEPYGNCTWEKGEGPFYYDTDYSVEGCFRSCIQKHIKDECGCYDPRFASPEEQYCENDKIDCLNRFVTPALDTSQQTPFNPVESCVCPQPCNESTFGVTVSTALWPSDVYNPPDCKTTSVSWANASDCQQWYARNTLLIEVYYERMNYQLLRESAAYGIVNLVSDMGGQLGLWMGISVITVVEFVSLMALLCIYCMTRKKITPDPDPNDDDDSEPDNAKET